MSDSTYPLKETNVETGAQVSHDMEQITTETGSGTGSTRNVQRPRVVIGGSSRAQVAAVLAAAPSSGDYGLVTRIVGTVTTSAGGSTEDSVHVSGDTGSFILGVRNDAAAATFVSADGDYSPIAVDSKGRVGITDLGDVISVDDAAGSLTVDNSTLAVVGGGTEATAMRVTIANDSTGVLSVDDNGTTISVDDGAGSLTIDNSTLSVLGTGTEASALRVTIATDSTGVLSVDDNGGSLTIDNAQLSVIGTGTEAAALRVTIATDSTGVLSVDDNGGSITVDGTITEASGAAIAASLSVMDDWDETDRAKVNVIVGQAGIAAGTGVDGVTVPRVTLATNVALPAGTNAIGKLAANSGVDIGDVDVTSIAAGSNIIGRFGHDITAILNGRTIVTTAGTRVVLAASTACKRIVIVAETDNTGLIVVGGTTVVASLATREGVPLNPGDAFELEIDNLNDVNLDSTVNGDGVTYTYFT